MASGLMQSLANAASVCLGAGVRSSGYATYQGISVGISVLALEEVVKAAHWAANCVLSAASSAESCGLVFEPLIATSKRMHVSRSEFIV